MRTARNVLLCLWLAGCAVANGGRADAAGDDGRWAAAMREVERACEDLETLLSGRATGDLGAAATRAADAAAWMRLGYGAHEDPTVRGYAQMARDCESWLLQVALEARGGHGDIAAAMFRDGVQQHCNECHEAHERTHAPSAERAHR